MNIDQLIGPKSVCLTFLLAPPCHDAKNTIVHKPTGGFPIEIETKISKLIPHSLAIFIIQCGSYRGLAFLQCKNLNFTY